MPEEEKLPKKNIPIAGKLHQFLLREAGEDDNYKKGIGIGDLVEIAIMDQYGIDENGIPLLSKSKRKNQIHLAKD